MHGLPAEWRIMMRVLSIGNSFSQDATAYVHQIAESAGENVETVNLYIGGCSLERHWNNLTLETEKYLKEVNGQSTGEYVTIREMLADGHWDYITLQQVSGASHKIATFFPFLTQIVDYLKENADYGELVMHQTWFYEDKSEMLANQGYEKHEDMFANIKKSYAEAMERVGIKKMIPSGQVFANLLDDGVGKIHRDHFHALIPFGHYVLGLVWYETLTGKSCLEADYVPEGMCAELARAAREMVHRYLV